MQTFTREPLGQGYSVKWLFILLPPSRALFLARPSVQGSLEGWGCVQVTDFIKTIAVLACIVFLDCLFPF